MASTYGIISALHSASKGFISPILESRRQESNEQTEAAFQALKAAVGVRDEIFDQREALILDAIAALESAQEELGFLNGFRLGVQLMIECERGVQD